MQHNCHRFAPITGGPHTGKLCYLLIEAAHALMVVRSNHRTTPAYKGETLKENISRELMFLELLTLLKSSDNGHKAIWFENRAAEGYALFSTHFLLQFGLERVLQVTPNRGWSQG